MWNLKQKPSLIPFNFEDLSLLDEWLEVNKIDSCRWGLCLSFHRVNNQRKILCQLKKLELNLTLRINWISEHRSWFASKNSWKTYVLKKLMSLVHWNVRDTPLLSREVFLDTELICDSSISKLELHYVGANNDFHWSNDSIVNKNNAGTVILSKRSKRIWHTVILLNFIIVWFKICELHEVHLIPRFYCVVMGYTDRWLY